MTKIEITFNGERLYGLSEVLAYLDKQRERISELEKENTDMKCECGRCVYTDSPCVLSDYGKYKNGICDHFKDVFDENAELKAKNKWYSEQVCNKECAEVWKNLTKAKEIIRELLSSCFGYNSKTVNYEVKAKAEQFLKDSEGK